MTDMIEIVAKRIYTLLHPTGTSWDDWANIKALNHDKFDGRDTSRKLARAAIEALRTPTDAMVEAGDERVSYPGDDIIRNRAEPVWQAMIDAALIVQPGGLERGIPVYRTDGDT